MKKYFSVFILINFSTASQYQTYNQGLNFTYLTNDSIEVYFKKQSDIVRYRSYKVSNNITSSKLWYSNNDFSSSVLINDMTIDTSISIFKWAIAVKIKQKADSLKTIISSTNVTLYSGLTDSLAFYISDSISGDTILAELFQVLFYHNSILKSIRRFNDGADSCYCDSYVGYVAGLSSFHCNQDIIVSVSDLKDHLEDSIDVVRRYGVEYLIEYLDNYSADQISFDEIFNKTYKESGGYKIPPFVIPFPCPWVGGGDCGCCGNHYGPCIMCSIICLMHDYQCQKCKPKWYCLRGCKPTPCN